MASYSRPSILDEISSFKGCEVAFLTTYNFDIPFFDRSVLPLLSIVRTRVVVFADGKQFQESITNNQYGNNIGKYYFVHPFRMEKAFHPKLILLLGKDKAKLIVSSANLTYSGYYSNNEVFHSFSYDEGHKDYLDLFIRAFKFFAKISSDSNSEYINEQIQYCIENYPFLSLNEADKWPRLLTNYNDSIITQTLKNINEDIKEITVATPFYDEELGALKYLKNIYKNAKINLYIQDYHSTFPKNKYSPDIIDTLNIFESINNNEHKQKQFYHGKVFSFKTSDKEYVLFGSPNFSISALVNSHKNGGNLEAAILDYGNIGDCDSFFDAFCIKKEANIDNLQINQYSNETKQINDEATFVNGLLTSGKVFVQIKSSLNIDLCTLVLNNHNDVLINVEKNVNGTYTLSFSSNALTQNIFNISFVFEDKTITTTCFVCNIDYLNNYIRSTSKNPFAKLTGPEEIENYDKVLFLQRFSEITSDIKMGIQQKQTESASKQLDVNDDTIDEEDAENFELDSILYESSNNEIIIGNHDIYLKADSYLSYYANKTSMLLSRGKSPSLKGEENINNLPLTDEEKTKRIRQKQSFTSKLLEWFRNFASLDNEKLNGLDFYTYFNIYELTSGTFICDLYINKAGIKNLSSLIETKIDYIINRIVPNIDNQAQQSPQFAYFKKEIALLCIECYFAKNNLPFNIENFKDVLFKLDRLYANTFVDEIELLIKEVCSVLDISGYVNIISYFKNFFINAPKTNELELALNKFFGLKNSSTILLFNEESSLLNIEINDIERKDNSSTFLSLTSDIQESIINYIKRYYGNKLDNDYAFILKINNYSENITELKFEWASSNYRKYMCTINYKSGFIRGPEIKSF